MGVELRAIEEDEAATYRRVSTIAFANQPPTEEELAEPWIGVELDRTLCAFDSGAMVGVSRVISFDFTVPGGHLPAVAGVADVGVMPTHRRQGVLTAMMQQTIEDAHRRGEPVALLTASEGGIYGRFGFGVAVLGATIEVTKEGAAVVAPADGTVELIDAATSLATIVPVFDATRRAGDVCRYDWWWNMRVAHPRRGGKPPFVAVHRSNDGAVDGYATYRINSGSDGRSIVLSDVVGLTPAAYAGLWRFLLGIDLVGKASGWGRAVDEPLRWMLNDPRKCRITNVGDSLWARLVDVPAALGARTYAVEGEVVIAVTDPMCPWNDGTFRLVAGSDGAECVRADGTSPDVTIGITALGSAWLGGVGIRALAAAGLVEEHNGGAIARADAVFSTPRPPHARTGF